MTILLRQALHASGTNLNSISITSIF